MAYTHLHIHTEFSLLTSLVRIQELVKRAKKQGFTALAITDKNNMYGTAAFYQACVKEDIKPILGAELTVSRNEPERGNAAAYTLLFYAKTYAGYQSLVQLATLAASREGLPFVTLEEVRSKAEDLLIISPFSSGEMQSLAEAGDKEAASDFLGQLKAIAGPKSVYVEIQNHWLPWERMRMQSIRHWLTANQVQVVATNHVHFFDKSQFNAAGTLQAIREGTSTKAMDDSLLSPEMYLKSEQEMQEQFAKWRQALDVTNTIADQCEVELPFGGKILPSYPLEPGQETSQVLRDWCEKGLTARVSDPDEAYQERLKKELRVIREMGYEDYFLIVADFMRFAHDQGILTGPGRGSAAGSIVAYVLGITDVDPLAYDLLFERFLNPERVSMPDIDIDFSDRSRDKVIHYVQHRYGSSHVAQIITFGTLAAKAALRDTARALEIPVSEVDQLTRQVPSRPNITLDEAYAESGSFRELLEAMPSGRDLFDTAKAIEGLARHTSIHAAGVVMSEHPLTDVVPLESGHDGLFLTQYPMNDLEALGLLKMDFLGLRNLSFMERIRELVYEKNGEWLDVTRLPIEDDQMFALFAKGATNGIFQLESQGMRRVLKQLRPSRFEDIVAVNALYRPGPMEQIPTFIARKNGEEPISYPHADLETILKPTYGVMIYQEQIMQIAAVMAGFSLAEADLLRRAVSKKKKEELDRSRTLFVSGAEGKGYSTAEAESVYDLIERFANYGFNRSHAVAYSMISCRLGWLKTHHPDAFMAALMEQTVHAPDKLVSFMAEARDMNLMVSGPSVQHSGLGVSVVERAIYLPLTVIRYTGVQAIEEIVRVRGLEGPFTSLFDFCKRVSLKKVNRRAIESLIMAGAMDDFGVERTTLFASLDDAIQYGDEEGKGFSLFDQEGGEPAYTTGGKMTLMNKLDEEQEAMGFYMSGHPVEDYEELLRPFNKMSIHEAIDTHGQSGKTVRVAGMVEKVRYVQTKKGEQMAFIHITDETGGLDVTVFPKVLKNHQMSLKKQELVFLEGQMQWRQDQWNLIMEKAITIDMLKMRKKDKQQPVLYLFISLLHEKTGKGEAVKEVLQDTPGDVPVVIKYESSGEVKKLSELWNIAAEDELLMKLEGILGKKNVHFRSSRV
ncbi:DNA polymerase III alpha subunit [Salisediminibacterium beveridgei]|uniref:DNA polymerase III subunit alpha n=1 Tax=Salisediminibacterium beveridgei TaxID=632773 RepID=A0A1D7QT98_9BACI|nr:DNA polymerase III alpha subunit [Salisediminibacterium beveridgei]